MKKKLTDRYLKQVSTQETQLDIYDEGFTDGCFGVRINPRGRKTFFVIYRHNGRRRRKSLGVYPDLSISKARKDARRFLIDVEDGTTAEQVAFPRGYLVSDLSKEFLETYPKQEGLSSKTVVEYRRIMKSFILLEWESREVESISRSDVNSLLDNVAFGGKKESPVMANRVLALLSVMFNFAIDRGYWGIEVNPCVRVKKRIKEKPRERVLTDDEIKILLGRYS